MDLKLGCNEFNHTDKTMRQAILMSKVLDEFGTPPTTSPGYSALADQEMHGDWDMLGNDRYGCCAFADPAHRIMLRTAQAGKIIKPTTQDTLRFYSEVTGFRQDDPRTDRGGNLVVVAEALQRKGMLIGDKRHKEAANGIIDPTNYAHIKWALCLFGCVPLAFSLPESALEQFRAGLPFDYVEGSRIAGGHDMLAIEYQPEVSHDSDPGWLVLTWGKRWPATQKFMETTVMQAVPVGADDFILPDGLAPSGIGMPRILQLLQAIK